MTDVKQPIAPITITVTLTVPDLSSVKAITDYIASNSVGAVMNNVVLGQASY